MRSGGCTDSGTNSLERSAAAIVRSKWLGQMDAIPHVKSRHGTIMPLSRFPHPTETAFMLTTAHIQPLAALLGGILILLVPRLLNFIVAIYLILVGLMGLGLRIH